MSFKYVISLLMVGVLVFVSFGCLLQPEIPGPGSGPLETEEFLMTYTVDAGTTLQVDNFNGAVNIHKWDKDVVEVYALKQTRYGRGELKNVDIEVSTGGVMTIETKRLTQNPRVSVNYEIKVPGDVIVDRVKTSNGVVGLDGTSGDARATTSNGAIDIRNVDGYVSADTSNGKINIAGTTGVMEARTSNGAIIVEIPDINRDLTIRTSNGAVSVYLPADLNADIEMRTSNGRVSIHDVTVTVSESSKNNFKGKIGSGGNRIYIETSNGAIDVYILD